MNQVILYGRYAIDVAAQTVSSPQQAEESHAREGLKEFVSDLLLGLLMSAIGLGVHLWLDKRVMENDTAGVFNSAAGLLFSVEFLTVRRHSRWFLANGFIWSMAQG